MSEPSIESLRSAGAGRLDPVRFHYLEALSRRIAGQPEPVQRLLQGKLRTAVDDYARRFAAASVETQPARVVPSAPRPLVQLNAYIRNATSARATETDEERDGDQLQSARRFRKAWYQARTEDQVLQAVARRPANAGPLNSHALVLQSLALMQELSTDYLRRFVTQIESLQWLEEAARQYPPAQAKQGKAAKPARRARARK